MNVYWPLIPSLEHAFACLILYWFVSAAYVLAILQDGSAYIFNSTFSAMLKPAHAVHDTPTETQT